MIEVCRFAVQCVPCWVVLTNTCDANDEIELTKTINGSMQHYFLQHLSSFPFLSSSILMFPNLPGGLTN